MGGKMTYRVGATVGEFLRAYKRKAIIKYGIGNAARKNEWVRQEQERAIIRNLFK